MQFSTTYCHASKKLIHFSLGPSLVSMPCSTPCNSRRTKTMQHPGWSKQVESFPLWSPRDLTTDQWKSSVLFVSSPSTSLRLCCFKDMGSMCTPPLLCLCLRASLILEGKNKMLTRSVILLTLSASERSRCRAEVKGTTSTPKRI